MSEEAGARAGTQGCRARDRRPARSWLLAQRLRTGGRRPRRALGTIVTAALFLGVLLVPLGNTQALAACAGRCSHEQLLTGLAHPPAWAAGRAIHFEPATAAASAYPERNGTTRPLGSAVPTPLLPQPEGAGEELNAGLLLFHELARQEVQHTPIVHLIFFGFSALEEHGAEAELKEMILTLFNGLSHSSYHEILTQYFDTLGQVAPTVTVDDWIDPTPPTEVEDFKVKQQVKAGIEANKERGWKAEPNAQFVVVTAPGATYKFSPGAFCAYHGVAGLYLLGAAVYSFIPYDGDEPFKRCSSPPETFKAIRCTPARNRPLTSTPSP